jgi:hypothetical protein
VFTEPSSLRTVTKVGGGRCGGIGTIIYIYTRVRVREREREREWYVHTYPVM